MSLSEALLLDPYPLNIYIAARTDGVKGSGTINDPWDGSTVAKFDLILSSIPANTKVRIHIGPGTFTTLGYADGVSGGWQPRAGWWIQGSGMDVTVIQLSAGTTADGMVITPAIDSLPSVVLFDIETQIDDALTLAFLK